MALITTDIFLYGLQLQTKRVTFENIFVRTKIKVTVIRLHIDCNCWIVRWRSYSCTIAMCYCMQVFLCIFFSFTYSFSRLFVIHFFVSFHLPFVSASSISFRFYLNTKPPILHCHLLKLGFVFSFSFISSIEVELAFWDCFSFVRFILILISHRKSYSNIILYHHDIIFNLFFAMLLLLVSRFLLRFQSLYRSLCLFFCSPSLPLHFMLCPKDSFSHIIQILM